MVEFNNTSGPGTKVAKDNKQILMKVHMFLMKFEN